MEQKGYTEYCKTMLSWVSLGTSLCLFVIFLNNSDVRLIIISHKADEAVPPDRIIQTSFVYS